MIVVDDFSSEDPSQIVSSFQSERIRYIRLDKNYGKWKALNVGVENSNGDIITSHDADDVALCQRIERQVMCMHATQTVHNLCGFYHCWNEEEVEKYKDLTLESEISYIPHDKVREMVLKGWQHPSINHYYTGNFETAGCSGMFFKSVWDLGIRFNPPGKGLRVLLSEDSDFNFRVTSLVGKTSVLAEQVYCYRRNTSTNSEEM